MENYTAPVPNQNLLDDVDMEMRLVPASGAKRFGNWVIDYLIIYFLWGYVFVKLLGAIISYLGIYLEDTSAFRLAFLLLEVVFIVTFLAAFESLTGGKTIGKFLTRTQAVNEDGTRISSKTALLHSLCRLVPLEPFSALGSPSNPWHDRWTHTHVIDEDSSRLPIQYNKRRSEVTQPQ